MKYLPSALLLLASTTILAASAAPVDTNTGEPPTVSDPPSGKPSILQHASDAPSAVTLESSTSPDASELEPSNVELHSSTYHDASDKFFSDDDLDAPDAPSHPVLESIFLGLTIDDVSTSSTAQEAQDKIDAYLESEYEKLPDEEKTNYDLAFFKAESYLILFEDAVKKEDEMYFSALLEKVDLDARKAALRAAEQKENVFMVRKLSQFADMDRYDPISEILAFLGFEPLYYQVEDVEDVKDVEHVEHVEHVEDVEDVERFDGDYYEPAPLDWDYYSLRAYNTPSF